MQLDSHFEPEKEFIDNSSSSLVLSKDKKEKGK